jgi:Tfp pilus assembly protein PilF
LYKGDLGTAMNSFTQALHIDPNCAEAYLGRGALYIAKKQYDLAIVYLNHAVRLQPNNAANYKARATA